MTQERHRIPLNEQITLIYHRQPAGTPLEACFAFPCGYASAQPGLWHALFRLLQRQLPEGWHSELEMTPDWALFSLQAMPELREQFYQQLLGLVQPQLQAVLWDALQPALVDEARFHQTQPETLFETAFFQLAWPGSGYDRSRVAQPAEMAALHLEQLQQACGQMFSMGKAYLRLDDSLPLTRALQALEPILQISGLSGTSPEPWPLDSDEALQQVLEYPVPGGAWVWQGFRVPGLLSEGWIHGVVLKHWLEQVQLLEKLPETVDALECRWQPWMRGSLLYLIYHVPQAAELEKAKYQVLEWLMQAREGYLTPRRLRKAIHACHSLWLQALRTEAPSATVLRLEELLHGSSRFKQRLQGVSLEGLQTFWRQYLQADNLLTLEVMHESVRKQRHRSYRELFPAFGYRPAAPARLLRPVQKLQTACRVDLGQGSFARLLPLPQASALCLGAWFDKGSRHEQRPGSTALLLSLLAQRFERLLQQQDSSGAYLGTHTLHWFVERDFSGFFWLAPAQEYRQALLLFRQMLETFQPERPIFDRCRHQLLADCQREQLSLLHAAQQRFYQSGFGNHPYARPSRGDYFSLQALSLEDLQQTWQELFTSSSFQPLLTGVLPQELVEGLLPELFSSPLGIEQAALAEERPLLLRRGEIQMQVAGALPLRLEGRIFAEPLPEEQRAALVLIENWLQQTLARLYPGLGVFHMEWLEKAWLYHLLLPDHPDSYLWRTRLSEADLPAFAALRQGAAFAVRRLKTDLPRLWPLLARWEALGWGATSLLDLDRELLVLPAVQVQDSLKRWFGERQEWLQIRIHS